jgi:hypothetical protein
MIEIRRVGRCRCSHDEYPWADHWAHNDCDTSTAGKSLDTLKGFVARVMVADLEPNTAMMCDRCSKVAFFIEDMREPVILCK